MHGILVASMFSAIIGNAFPGAIYLSQTLKFAAPVPGLCPKAPLFNAMRACSLSQGVNVQTSACATILCLCDCKERGWYFYLRLHIACAGKYEERE